MVPGPGALMVVLATLAATAAGAADDPVKQAMQLYEKRHYRDAGHSPPFPPV